MLPAQFSSVNIFFTRALLSMDTFQQFKNNLLRLFFSENNPTQANITTGQQEKISLQHNQILKRKDNPQKSSQNQSSLHQKQFSKEVPVQVSTIKGRKPLRRKIFIQKVDCSVCALTVKKSRMMSICLCAHQYCKSCVTKFVLDKLQSFSQIKCLEESCQAALDMQGQFFKTLSISIKKKTEKMIRFHATLKNSSIKLCPDQKCEGTITYIKGQPFSCNICNKVYCTNCLYEKHDGKCMKNEAIFLCYKYRYRKCGSCGMMVEKSQACNHMTCICGYQFCYGCGKKWKGSHSCKAQSQRLKIQRQWRQTHNEDIERQQTCKERLMAIVKMIGKSFLTLLLLLGVSIYGIICLLPIMSFLFVGGVVFGCFLYSLRFIRDKWKTDSWGAILVYILVFPISMMFGVRDAFRGFWGQNLLFWWQLLVQAIEKPLQQIWQS